MTALDARRHEVALLRCRAEIAGIPGLANRSDQKVAAYTHEAQYLQAPTIDPELGMLYFTTATLARLRRRDATWRQPVHGIVRRAGLQNGYYKWHFQQVHHDIWDFDAPIRRCCSTRYVTACCAKASIRLANRLGTT
jgi:hypothetical protein